jgi:hypothetical protein
VTLFLVRHGPLLGDELDPAGFDEVWALRDRLPQGALWFTAPEPAVTQTAQLLTDGDVGILAGLRQQEPGEARNALHERVVGTATALVRQHPESDLVLVGHLECWVELAGDAAARLGTPDVIEAAQPLGSGR